MYIDKYLSSFSEDDVRKGSIELITTIDDKVFNVTIECVDENAIRKHFEELQKNS